MTELEKRFMDLTAHGEKEDWVLSPKEVEMTGEGGTVSLRAKVKTGEPLRAEKALTVRFSAGEGVRWMAIEHYSPFWCRPVFGQGLGTIPAETQFLLWRQGSKWCALLPLCGKNYAASLRGEGDAFCLDAFTLMPGLKECADPLAAYGEGADAYQVMEETAELASRLTGAKLRRNRAYPEILEYLGWCSWDAMEIWVNEEGVLEKCREFAQKQVPVRWGILDDMWADVAWKRKLPPFSPHDISFDVMHASKLKDYTADPERFPGGLKNCIAKMKAFGLKVGVWHPVTGYWLGLEAGSEADRKLKPYTVTTDEGLILPDLRSPEKTKGFFDVIHEELKDCGADFLKIDNQSCLRTRFGGLAPLGVMAENLQKAIDASAQERFSGQLINCMGMASENLFHRSSAVSRCSDDFQPENRAWFAKHLMACAYNGLWQGQFQVNDWDMWWTDDGQALKNSVLRAVSGGPVYVSDRIGRTRGEVLEPLCFGDGRICRCDGVAVPDEQNLVEKPTTSAFPMMIHNRCKNAVIVAAFNINEAENEVRGFLSPKNYGFTGPCVVYDFFGRTARELGPEEKLNVILPTPEDFKLWILLPKGEKRTVIGLAEKMICPGAIVSETGDAVTLYEGGTLAWFDGELHLSRTGTEFRFPGAEG